jgi:hypothetical protein
MTSLRDPFLLTLKTLCERSSVRSEPHRLNLTRPVENADVRTFGLASPASPASPASLASAGPGNT